MRLKLWLLMLVLVGGGIGLIYLGGREVLHNRKLAAEGKRTTAIVIDKREQPLYKNNKSRHVTVAFQTEAGQKIQDELMVMPHIYGIAVPGKPIEVTYSPKEPSIFIIGRAGDANYTKFGMGCVFLPLGVLLCWFLIKNPTAGVIKRFTEEEMLEDARPVATEAAQKIVQQMGPLTQAKHEFQTADAKNFPHLDLEFYDSTRRFLEGEGYVYLEDLENVTVRKSGNNPDAFLRVMLSGDRHIMVAAYHLKPPLAARAIGAKESKVLDLETQFSNGHFVCTHNAEEAGKLNAPAEVDRLIMPRDTPQVVLLKKHQERVAAFIGRTGAHPVRIENMADLRRAQDELQRLKAAHRQATGLSKKELEALGGKKSDAATNLMFEEILKEHQRVQGKKAA